MDKRQSIVVFGIFSDFGITCILPDFFRGVSKPTPPPSWEFGGLREDWEFKLNPYLLERGARKVGVVGTCFGSYIVIHTNADDFSGLMFGGVSIHPAHGGLIADNGEDEEVLYSNIRSPQYFMNTPDSPDTTRPEGLADQIIETVCTKMTNNTHRTNLCLSRPILMSTQNHALMDSSTEVT